MERMSGEASGAHLSPNQAIPNDTTTYLNDWSEVFKWLMIAFICICHEKCKENSEKSFEKQKSIW